MMADQAVNATHQLSYVRPERSQTSWRAWSVLARVLVGGLFLAAAYGKIAEPAKFADSVRNYRMLPVPTTNVFAYTLPWLEVLAAAGLIIGVWRAESRFIIFALLIVFTAAKLYVAGMGYKIDCGCFGGTPQWITDILNGPTGIVLNVLLMGLLIVDWQAHRRALRARLAPS